LPKRGERKPKKMSLEIFPREGSKVASPIRIERKSVGLAKKTSYNPSLVIGVGKVFGHKEELHSQDPLQKGFNLMEWAGINGPVQGTEAL
jgi:hypothetical protein